MTWAYPRGDLLGVARGLVSQIPGFGGLASAALGLVGGLGRTTTPQELAAMFPTAEDFVAGWLVPRLQGPMRGLTKRWVPWVVNLAKQTYPQSDLYAALARHRKDV